jgi:hypothetical protein
VTELDQELPGREARHRYPGRVRVVEVGRLASEIFDGCGDVLRVRGAVHGLGEAQETEDLVAHGERGDVVRDGGDHPGHVRAERQRQVHRRAQVGRHLGHARSQVPVRRVEPAAWTRTSTSPAPAPAPRRCAAPQGRRTRAAGRPSSSSTSPRPLRHADLLRVSGAVLGIFGAVLHVSSWRHARGRQEELRPPPRGCSRERGRARGDPGARLVGAEELHRRERDLVAPRRGPRP